PARHGEEPPHRRPRRKGRLRLHARRGGTGQRRGPSAARLRRPLVRERGLATPRPAGQVPGEGGARAVDVPLSRALPGLVEPGLTPRQSLARDRFLLDAVAASPERWPAALRVFDVADEAVSLGRWQLPPDPAGAGAAPLRRRP